MTELLEIGGRKFKRVEQSTAEHDFYAMGCIRTAKLDRVEFLEGETPEDFVHRLLGEIILSGQIFPILGAFLIPDELEPLDWTPKIAGETAEFLRKVSDPESKAIIQTQVVSLVMGFFANGVSYLTISQKSLNQNLPG